MIPGSKGLLTPMIAGSLHFLFCERIADYDYHSGYC